jgi:light-independent protochlorophyllide reductase subunit B
MKLAYWMYAGPAHIGVLRVTSSFKNVHAIMHAPLGDDYFNVMRSMLERERDFTPVTASIVDRHVLARGSQEKVVENIIRKNKEESPDLILLTPTCTSSILQEDLHNFVERSTLSLTGGNTIPYGESPNGASHEAQSKRANDPLSPSVTSGLRPESSQSSSKQPEPGSGGHSATAFTKNFVENFLGSPPNSQAPVQGSDKHYGIVAEPSLESKQTNNLEQSPDVILADVNHYRVNELQAADRTLEQIVRYYIEKAKKQNTDGLDISKTEKPSVNIIGIFTLGFHNQHDCRELKRLFNDLGITINEIIPEGGNVNNLKNLPKAWFNFVPYREVGLMTAIYLKSEFNMPYVSITPMGLVDTALCIREIGQIISKQLTNAETTFNLLDQRTSSLPELHSLQSAKNKKGLSDFVPYPEHKNVKGQESSRCSWAIENLFNKYIDQQTRFVSQAAWFSRSIDCQNLTGKKAVVFGDATHAAAMTKILAREMGIRVSCAGTYCKHDADWFREQVTGFCDQILITDDHTQVGDTIAKLEPAAIFGTQMERHVGKRLDIPCGVISAPVHIQNFPLGYRPFLGYEGTNQIADLVYNSFNLGMEDHLLQIFGGHDSIVQEASSSNPNTVPAMDGSLSFARVTDPTKIISNALRAQSNISPTDLWVPESLAELNKVPGFVRGKVKRNTEKYALQNNISVITVEVMYAAKEALST